MCLIDRSHFEFKLLEGVCITLIFIVALVAEPAKILISLSDSLLALRSRLNIILAILLDDTVSNTVCRYCAMLKGVGF